MEEDSYLSKSFKFGIIIFIPLAIIISLFPPFHWDIPSNQKNNYTYNEIKELLPLKKYSLIFDTNKKYFVFGSYIIEKKYSNTDYDTLSNFLKDAITYKYFIGSDTIYNIKRNKYYRVVHRDTKGLLKNLYGNEGNFIFDFTDKNEAEIKLRELNIPYIVNGYDREGRIWMLTSNQKTSIDTIKKFRKYSIVKPKYYLLNREILLSELSINYLLAFFISIGIGLLFTRFKLNKYGK